MLDDPVAPSATDAGAGLLQAPSPEPGAASPKICSHCAAIDFDLARKHCRSFTDTTIFKLDPTASWVRWRAPFCSLSSEGVVTIRIDHVHAGRHSGCEYCRFFDSATIYHGDGHGDDQNVTVLCLAAPEVSGFEEIGFGWTRFKVGCMAVIRTPLDRLIKNHAQRDAPWGFNSSLASAILGPGNGDAKRYAVRAGPMPDDVHVKHLHAMVEECSDVHHWPVSGSVDIWEKDFGTKIPGWNIIDCTTRRVVGLEECAKQAGGSFRDVRYVALSYVWGTKEEAVEDYLSAEAGQLPATLPNVFEDAITLATELGYRFLWIDRYCVPHLDVLEEHAQMQNMNLIYRRACLTIIAAAGDGPHHGIPGVKTNMRRHQFLDIKLGSARLLPLPTIEEAENAIIQSKWNTRGWTYQEAVLSKKRLFFTDTFCLFDHPFMSGACFEGPGRQFKVFPNHADWSQEVSGLLQDHASNYCRRFLSYETDTLDAFRGILTQLTWMANNRPYFYGLPLPYSDYKSTHTFADSLAWQFDDPKPELPGIKIRRRLGAPSWTWLGWHVDPHSSVKGPFFSWDRDFRDGKEIFTEAASFQLEFKDGTTHDISASTISALQAMKAEKDDGDVRAMIAYGWTFSAEALLSGSEKKLPAFYVVEGLMAKEAKNDPLRYKVAEQTSAWAGWKDWAAVHGHAEEELFDESKALLLVLRHTGEESLMPPRPTVATQQAEMSATIETAYRPKGKEKDLVEVETAENMTPEASEEDFVMVTEEEDIWPVTSETEDVATTDDHPDPTSDSDDDIEEYDDDLGDFMSDDEAPLGPPSVEYQFEDEYKLSTTTQVALAFEDQEMIDRKVVEENRKTGTEGESENRADCPAPPSEVVDLLVLSSGDGGQTWERVGIVKIQTEEGSFRKVCDMGEEGAGVVRELRIV